MDCYNGHMNVAYYTLAFDKALDDFLENNLEIGPIYVKKEKKDPILFRLTTII